MPPPNRGRIPGPVGTGNNVAGPQQDPGLRPPGPLGVGADEVLPAEDGSSSVPLDDSAKTSVKITEPEPVFKHSDLTLKNVVTPLFDGNPKPEDVVQGYISNCPLCAVLVAVAHAKSDVIKNMISERTTEVHSTRKSDSKFSVKTDKLLVVQFQKGNPVELSRLLYHDGDNDLIYAHSSNNVSWVNFIEKAYAVLRGRNSYNGLSERTQLRDPPSANEVMEDVVGSYEYTDPTGVTDKELAAVLGKAKTHPTIAASRDELPEESSIVNHHGYGVMKLTGGTVHLRNPWGGAKADVKLTLKEFKTAFQAILQAK